MECETGNVHFSFIHLKIIFERELALLVAFQGESIWKGGRRRQLHSRQFQETQVEGEQVEDELL